ncbi:hypothetical protein BC833DRAFT_573764 [Globomyces pollinis-pini]|nr:hypothetical protein BC833DRAFT_573764 [Globomyces pollinis-pini]
MISENGNDEPQTKVSTQKKSSTDLPEISDRDVSELIANVMDKMRSKFEDMSNQILTNMDQMSSRMDELEKSLNQLNESSNKNN